TISYEREKGRSMDVMYYNDQVFWIVLAAGMVEPEDHVQSTEQYRLLCDDLAHQVGQPAFEGTPDDAGFPRQFEIALRACEWNVKACKLYATLSQAHSRTPLLIDVQIWRGNVLPTAVR